MTCTDIFRSHAHCLRSKMWRYVTA